MKFNSKEVLYKCVYSINFIDFSEHDRKKFFLFKFIQISPVPYIYIRNNSNNFGAHPL